MKGYRNLLFLSVLLLFGCKGDKMNPNQLTNVSVIRNVTAELRDSIVSDSVALAIVERGEPTATVTIDSSPQIKEVNKRYHIIAGSLPTKALADRDVIKLREEGYTEAKVITGNGRYRVVIASFETKDEVIKNLNVYMEKIDRYDLWWLRN